MHAESSTTFEANWIIFKSEFQANHPVFVAYFEKTWLKQKTLWAKAWRPVSVISVLID